MKRAICCVLIGLMACSPARREVENDIVRSVRFEGNRGALSGHNDYQLRAQMEQQASDYGILVWPLMYFSQPTTLDYRLLNRDAYRLEVWYANHGWFDARVDGFSVSRVRKARGKRAAVFDITGFVSPGKVSTVRSIDMQGLSRTQGLLGKTVLRTGDLREGDAFSLEYAYSNRDQLLQLLHDHAHAYAEVELLVDAYPDAQKVDITYAAIPGITTVFGPISISGNEKIKTEHIEKTLPMKTGEAYRYATLSVAQRRIFDMQTFSLVTITPDLSDPTRREVPIEVHVGEARPRRLRAGFGVEYDGLNLTPKLSTSFRHVNLFRELLRFESEARVGFLYAFSSGWRELPTVYAKGAFSYPRLFGHRASIDASYTYQLDYQAGQFPVELVDTELNLHWKVTDHLLWSFGPDWRWFTYRLESAPAVTSALGTFSQDASRLLKWKTTLSLDWRDDPTTTRRGSYYSYGLNYAIPIGALMDGQEPISEWHYLSASAEARRYVPVRFRKNGDFPFVLAGRMYGEWIGGLGGSGIPYIDRVFLGGSTTLRGFRRDQVGVYDCVCLGEGDELSRYYFPEGGELLGGLSSEFRYDWAYGLSFATFVDAAMLVDQFSDIDGQALRLGFGVGTRYTSLIGPVRLDIALRPTYPEDYGARSYPGCDADERLPRSTDLLGGSRQYRLTRLEDRPPVALNIYFTFGEAI